MTTRSNLNSYGEELEKLLQLKTFPLAIKFLENESDIPKDAIKPTKDLDCHLALCQAFAMSRREQKTMVMLKEDNWCYAPVLALGLAKSPDYILEGNMEYPERIASQEAAKNVVSKRPILEQGKYIGVVSAPLKSASFEPDLLMIYCNSAQLRSLLSAIRYKEGYQVTSILEPGGACIQGTIPVMLSGECNVAVPCLGDRRLAMALDDEMIFSIPLSKLDDLMLGLRHFSEAHGFPIPFMMKSDYPLSEDYAKMGRIIGLDIAE
ncbi:DUF169 domain-containing protein [Chloroflexota bacterium]